MVAWREGLRLLWMELGSKTPILEFPPSNTVRLERGRGKGSADRGPFRVNDTVEVEWNVHVDMPSGIATFSMCMLCY